MHNEINEYSYYYKTKEGHIEGPYRTAAAIKSAMKTSYWNRGIVKEGITIIRAKMVFDEEYIQEYQWEPK